MNPKPLHAHSFAEVSLHLMATPCKQCACGPLRAADFSPRGLKSAARTRGDTTVTAVCRACGHAHEFEFALPQGAPVEDPDDLYPIINPTDQPSAIIDVGQWITLFRMILTAASKETDKIEARRLGYEAALCLEEAIKFYDDNELPPEDAVFCDATRARLREHPEQFAKQRLRNMRARLPKTTTMQRRIRRDAQTRTGPRRPWWKFWP